MNNKTHYNQPIRNRSYDKEFRNNNNFEYNNLNRNDRFEKKFEYNNSNRTGRPEKFYDYNNINRNERPEKFYDNNNINRNERPEKNFHQSIKLFFEEKYIRNLLKDNYLEKIKNSINPRKLYIENNMRIPNLDGKFIIIFDFNSENKYKCVSKIVRDYKKFSEFHNTLNYNQEIEIKLTIPEKITAQFIGSEGRNVNSLKKKFNVKIIVDNFRPGLRDRIVTIKGYYKDIIKCIEKINVKVEALLIDESKGYNKNFENDKILEEDIRINLKLLFDKNQFDFFKYKIDNLKEKFNIDLTFNTICNEEFETLKFANIDDYIIIIDGKFKNIKLFVEYILDLLEEENEKINSKFELFKIIIKNNLVTKLIGVKGSMIREIASRSSGAQIKILSDRESEKTVKDCLITVAGSLSNKKIALKIIIEKIELFKQEPDENMLNSGNYKFYYYDNNNQDRVVTHLIFSEPIINFLDKEIFNNLKEEFNCFIEIEDNKNIIFKNNYNNLKILKIDTFKNNIHKIIEIIYIHISKFENSNKID